MNKRIVNRELLNQYINAECVKCGTIYTTSGHHVKSKGSGGHDIECNLMPLCFVHHTEVHQIGLNKFSSDKRIKEWLLSNGWEFDKSINKWRNYALYETTNETNSTPRPEGTNRERANSY